MHARTHRRARPPPAWGRKFPPTPRPLSSVTSDPDTRDLLLDRGSFTPASGIVGKAVSSLNSLLPRRIKQLEQMCGQMRLVLSASYLAYKTSNKKKTTRNYLCELLITVEIKQHSAGKYSYGFSAHPPVGWTILLSLFPACCLLRGRPPPAAGWKRNTHCLLAFVPAGLQWGWAVCSLGQGLQIMTRRGLVDLWSLWPISQRSLIQPPIGPCEVYLTLWPSRKRQRREKKKSR